MVTNGRVLGKEGPLGLGDGPLSITPAERHDVVARKRLVKAPSPTPGQAAGELIITGGRRPAPRIGDAGIGPAV